MALEFKCPNCQAEAVVQFLSVGEHFLCRSCGKSCAVPDTASGIPGSSTSVPPSAQSPMAGPSYAPRFEGLRTSLVGKRLLGRFLDVLVTTFGLAMFVGMLAMMIVLILRPPDSPEMQDFSIAGNVVLSAFGIVFGAGLIYCQVHFMTESGQTLGKKVAGLKLVSVDTHLKPGVFKGYVLRELVRSPALLLLLYIPTVLPNILVFAYLIADLFSLGTDSGRCLHDRICGTLVVGVEEEHPEGTATATD